MAYMAKSNRRTEPVPDAPSPKKRNAIFVSLDDDTEAAIREFIAAQRIPPDRSAVGFTALVELLTREGYLPRKK